MHDRGDIADAGRLTELAPAVLPNAERIEQLGHCIDQEEDGLVPFGPISHLCPLAE